MALRRAAESGNAEKVKDLLGRKANVHERERYGGYTALHYATSAAVARLLLEAQADADEKSFAGTTPLQLAQRRGNADLVRLLQRAEVEEAVRAQRVEVRRRAAADQLAQALVSRGVPDLGALEAAQPEVVAELRQDETLRKLLVQASAVQEAEVLLGLKPAAGQRTHAALVERLQADSYDEVKQAIEDHAPDLMQRDPHGNVPAHHCRSVNCYRLLVAKDPRCADVRNKGGSTPLDCLFQHIAGIDAYKEFWSAGLASTAGEGERAPLGPDVGRLLRLDGTGVSLAMRAESKAKEWLFEQVSPWDDIQRMLKMLESLPEGLDRVVPEGHWEEVLALHLFGEADVWKEGKITAQCQVRLEEFGSCIKALCQRVLKRSPEADARHALRAVQRLLAATTGPQKLADAREPYRKELSLEILHLAMQSEAIHSILYDMMTGPQANFLKVFPDDRTWEKLDPLGKLKPDQTQQHRDRPKLRMDFQYAEGGRHLAAPSWAHAGMEFDLARTLADLRHVGGRDLQACLGEETFGDADVAYRMLEGTHGFGPDAFPPQLARFCQPSAVFWHCLWLRGLCQGRHERVVKGLAAALHHLEPQLVPATGPGDPAATLLTPPGALALGDVCAQVLEEMHDIYAEIREGLVPEGPGGADPDPEAEATARRLMAAAPNFVLGTLRATLVFEDAEGIVAAYDLLKRGPGGVLRVRNTLHRKARLGDECRSLQVWVPIKADRYGPLVVEVTMLLADDHAENAWHSLALEYFRGQLDRHMKPKRPTLEELERYIKVRFQLNPSLIPESKSKHDDSAVDEETARKMRDLAERRAKEAERLAQEEARRKREELERKLKEASADFDPADCVVVGQLTFRPPVEVLPKTRRSEAKEMEKLDKFNARKAAQQQAAQRQTSGDEDDN